MDIYLYANQPHNEVSLSTDTYASFYVQGQFLTIVMVCDFLCTRLQLLEQK